MDQAKRHLRKAREGRVCSDKADKTIVVMIERRVRHPSLVDKEIRRNEESSCTRRRKPR